MEPYAIAQMEDERFGIGLVPAFSKGWREMKAAAARDQAVKEELVDVFRLGVSAYARIKIWRDWSR